MLSIEHLSKSFGGLKAVDDVSLEIPRSGVSALIGPNGAGKTTVFALITGFHKPDTGRVVFQDADITGLPPHKIAQRGMVRTFQIVQPFAGQSVRDNIAVGAHLNHLRRADALEKAERVAEHVGLGDRLGDDAASLTIAGRKRLELARALATDPTLILLDEVMAGLNPSEIRDIVPVINQIAEAGITILLIEHVMQAVMSLAEQVYVLNQGRLIAHGDPHTVTEDPNVIEAYLGSGMAERLKRGDASG